MSNLINRISNTNYLVNNYRIIKDNDFIGKNYLSIMYFRMEYGIVGNTKEITNKQNKGIRQIIIYDYLLKIQVIEIII